MSIEARQGTIVAICTNPNSGYPTVSQERAVVGPTGIEGDSHADPNRISLNKGFQKPNRHILIVSDEVRQEMNEIFDINMQPGDFNEQILVTGLGDLTDVERGDQFHFETGVVLEATDPAFGCANLERHNGGAKLIKALREVRGDKEVSKRGRHTRVLQTGDLQPGVSVTVKRPPKV